MRKFLPWLIPESARSIPWPSWLWAGVMLFVFKEGSRNAFDNDRKESVFRRNYQRAFHLQLPGMDAVEDLYRLLEAGELEKLKTFLIKELVEKKVFHRFRFLGRRYLIAIDGTGGSQLRVELLRGVYQQDFQ